MDHLAAKRRERGEVIQADISAFSLCTKAELISLLGSEIAFKRSCAAISLRKYKTTQVVDVLCKQLTNENMLYTKIAICETMAEIGEISIGPLIGLLGRIGGNQEATIPGTGFYKTSYPLPRDIAARTLCRMGGRVIKPLEVFFESSADIKALTEAVDAYGHVVYTNHISRTSRVLQELYEAHGSNSLLTYKITRCLSGFTDEWAKSFLLKTMETGSEGLRVEALRSLLLLKVYLPDNIQDDFTEEMCKLQAFFKNKLT